MPGSSKAIHPSGVEIEFFEDTHKYVSTINGQEISYFSGTGFVGKFFQPFDPTGKITERCALKEGVSVEELKARWAAKGKESCRLGTRTHEICEDIELGRDVRHTPENEVEARRFQNASRMAKSFYDRLDILGVEKIVFSPSLRLAGTIDLFARSRKDGTYLIIDHKTNESIDQENTYKKFALKPIEHVADTNFWHYALQLNFYQYMLQAEGYVQHNAKFRLFLNHVTENGANLLELPQMQLEIRDMLLEHLKSGMCWKK